MIFPRYGAASAVSRACQRQPRWSLAHGLSHLLIDGAFEGLPVKHLNPDTPARKLSERLFD